METPLDGTRLQGLPDAGHSEASRSRLVKMRVVNIGCIGPEGLDVELDNIICLVGANNTGKSTVLRAYELAVGTEKFNKERDLCLRAEGKPAYVELLVHIPKGTANVAEKWKKPEGELLLVKSRWEWNESSGWSSVRRTWDPEVGDFSQDDRASGLDTVFGSRLPKPFRIGTLDNPVEEHKRLIMLVLQPVADKLKALLADKGSALNKALRDFTTIAQEPVKGEQEKLNGIKDELNRYHNEIFPDLSIDFDVGLGEIEIDPIKLLQQNSQLKFIEWRTSEVNWHQQGTGSQRALFWTMLQVRSKLNALRDIVTQNSKEILECRKEATKLEKEAEKAKKPETKQEKQERIRELCAKITRLQAQDPQTVLAEQSNEVALPGFMLLIDEPEVALHPSAVRAASNYLYALAEDPAWQVMITTHSPAFINPLHDHTTIVRLDRCQSNLTPKTYRSDDAGFTDDAKTTLKMLNRFDQGLSEMFFGQYPILVEGDTEFAAFETVMSLCPGEYPAPKRPVLVRARGKSSMVLVMKMLRHFRIPYSVLFDTDAPLRRDGKKNSAWTANEDLYAEICATRKCGIRVVHRTSLPNFELAHLPIERDEVGAIIDTSKEDKPWNVRKAILDDEKIRQSVATVFKELMSATAGEEPFESPFPTELAAAVKAWATKNAPSDPRFRFE